MGESETWVWGAVLRDVTKRWVWSGSLRDESEGWIKGIYKLFGLILTGVLGCWRVLLRMGEGDMTSLPMSSKWIWRVLIGFQSFWLIFDCFLTCFRSAGLNLNCFLTICRWMFKMFLEGLGKRGDLIRFWWFWKVSLKGGSSDTHVYSRNISYRGAVPDWLTDRYRRIKLNYLIVSDLHSWERGINLFIYLRNWSIFLQT